MKNNKNYKWITAAFTMAYGYYTGLGALINGVMRPFGYTSREASIMGLCFLLSGLAGAFIVSPLLDRTKKFLFILRCILAAMLLFVALTAYTLPSKNFPLLAINGALAGFVTIPIIPVAFSFTVEVTHPVSEALSNGVMLLCSQVFGIIVCYIGTHLAATAPIHCVYMFTGQVGLALIASFFIKEDLRRVNL